MEKSAAGLEMQKNIILNSLRESLASAWKNKMLFIFLFLLQLIFFSVFSVVNYYYQSKIIQSSNEIFDYLSRQKLDELSVADSLLQQKNILGEDYMLISRNFNGIIKNFRIYMAYMFILLVIFSSVSWTLTNQFFGSINIKKLSRILSRNFIVLLFYLGIIGAKIVRAVGVNEYAKFVIGVKGITADVIAFFNYQYPLTGPSQFVGQSSTGKPRPHNHKIEIKF